MIRTEPIIGVEDVEKSSQWYQKLLDCKGSHGGNTFEVLTDTDETIILCLHKWGEHNHPTLTAPGSANGNGLILYIKVSNLDTVWSNANRLQSKVEVPPRLNTNSGLMEFSIRDMDGYYLLITTVK